MYKPINYEIIEESNEFELQMKITGIKHEKDAYKIIELIKKAEIVFDNVFVEFERVYECLYDCIRRRICYG